MSRRGTVLASGWKLPPRPLIIEGLKDFEVSWLNGHLKLAGCTDFVYRNHLCIPPSSSGKGGCECARRRARNEPDEYPIIPLMNDPLLSEKILR